MSWLRLAHLEGETPQLIHHEGKLIEVRIDCRTKGPPAIPVNGCCLIPELLKNGTKKVRVRDRRIEPVPTWLVIHRQRFRCRNCGSTVYEELPDVDDHHYVTRRLKEDIVRSAIKRPFEDAAHFHAVEPTLVRRIFKSYARQRLDGYEFAAPRVLGVDENRILGSNRFVCADIEAGTILDMLPSRDTPTIEPLFQRMEAHGRVEVFCQDMWRGYETLAKRYLPKALVVIDKFHVVRMANDAMDNARRTFAATLTNETRKKMRRQNRIFLSRWESLSEERQDKLAAICAEFPFLQAAYTFKERFFDLYELENRAAAEAAYLRWRDAVPSELRPFFAPVVRVMKNWGIPIFNYYEAKYTNGLVENLNGRINEINRRGYGYDFETLRAKALLRYGTLVPLGDLVHFSFPLAKSAEDVRRMVETPIGKRGVRASTLAGALARGTF
ncbi:ISL3 family transposase [Pedomonas sp. V897]|uniref:ISL3 family transposase n=1 Tax=Pedomonas sp. V897 TaxID=3446482 RepID=UPI003EE3AC12